MKTLCSGNVDLALLMQAPLRDAIPLFAKVKGGERERGGEGRKKEKVREGR